MERFRGLFFGEAIGDALGMPLEHVTRAEACRYYGTTDVMDFLEPHPNTAAGIHGLSRGQYTDDTAMTLATAEAIVVSRAVDIKAIADALLQWHQGNASSRYQGHTTRLALERYARTRDPLTCGVNGSGCGAAIRIAPVAAALSLATNGFDEAVDLVAGITHLTPTALDGARCMAHMVVGLLNGESPSQLLCALPAVVRSDEFKTKLETVKFVLARGYDARRATAVIGNTVMACEAVPLALWFFVRFTSSFAEGVTGGASAIGDNGGDTDSIAAMTGTLLGTHLGAGAIPEGWMNAVEDRSKIEDLARAVYSLVAKGPVEVVSPLTSRDLKEDN